MTRPTTLEDIDVRLQQILFLLAQQSLSGVLKDATQREKIAFLNKAGLKNEEIATLLGTTSRVVIVELSALRKTTGKNGKKFK